MAISQQNIPSCRTILKQLINQTALSCEAFHVTYSMMIHPLLDEEIIFNNSRTVKECEQKVREVYTSLVELDRRLSEIDLQILYGPPPFFNVEDND